MPPRKKKSVEESSKILDSFKRVKKPQISVATDKNQKDTNFDEIHEILKEFDLNADYGPIVGILRSDRYKRAISFDLPVKLQVKEILEDATLLEEHPELDFCIWHYLENII